MTATLTIHLLGDFRLLHDDQPLTAINADRPQSLLAYLLLHRQAPQPRQQLAFLLWPDSPESQARTNLRNLLFGLRQAIPNADAFIASDNLTVQWRSDAPFVLDVACFEDALQRAGKTNEAHTQAALEEAIACYSGDLLPGNYDDWLIPLREELRQRFQAALSRLSDLLEAQGDYRAALQASQRLLLHDPLNEQAYVQLMRLHARSGDRAGVRRIYQQCVAVLERELAVEPSPTTTKAYEKLLRLQPKVEMLEPRLPEPAEAPTSTTPEAPSLPQPRLQPKAIVLPATPFLGRTTDLAEIEQRLRDPDCRLLTLVGLGGIGKTRLALHSAVQCGPHFAAGVAFVPLAGVQDVALIWQAIASALNLPLAATNAPAEKVLQALQQATLLLVLDNLEQLLADITPITELLAAAPSVKLLATSRERLNLQEEWVYEVKGLAVAEASAEDVGESAASALFVQVARRIQSGFAPNPSNAAAIQQICQLVEGMPLGIELAAAWVHVLSPSEIVQEIERNLDFLATPARNVPERHRTLRAVFDQSWRLLSAEEQRVLRQLAVFRGGFGRKRAAAVAGATLPLLSALGDKSLVRRTSEGRYEIHERVRQYAYRQLHEAGEAAATWDRHLAALSEIEEQLRSDLYATNRAQVIDEILVERDNLYAALDWSLRQQPTASFHERVRQGIHLVSVLAMHWHLLGNIRDGLQWVELALAHVPLPLPDQVDQPQWLEARARALAAAGDLMATLDNLPGVQEYLQASIALWRTLDNKVQLLHSLQRLLETVGSRGERPWVDTLTAEALALAQGLNNPLQLARTLAIMADIASERGQFDEAEQWAEQALTLFRANQAVGMVIYMLNIRGQIAIYRDQPQTAITLLHEAETIWQASPYAKLGDHPWTLRNLGLAYQQAGRYAAALTSYQRSLQCCYEQARTAGVAWAIEGLAEVAALTGDPARAVYLWALAERLRQEAHSTVSPPDQKRHDQLQAQVRDQLDEEQFAQCWAEGAVGSYGELISATKRFLPPTPDHQA